MRRLISFGILSIPLLLSAAAPDLPYWAYDGEYGGVRNISMGATGAAEMGEDEAVFYNPAGIGSVPNNSWNFTALLLRSPSRDLPPLNKQLLGIGIVTPQGGLVFQPLSSYYLETGGVKQEIKINRYSLALSLPQGDKFVIGMGLNYFSGRWAEVPSDSLIQDGNGMGLDWGVIYRITENLNYGLFFKNFPASIGWETGTEKLPVFVTNAVNVRVGEFISFNFDLEERNYRKDTPEGKELKIRHLGIEHNILDTLCLRAGLYGTDPGEKKKATVTYGIGYRKDKVELSLASKAFYREGQKVSEYLAGLSLPF
ncbi:MAG TPA: hypothetical protein VJC03_03620 [bacterium]|nr:hypothetical protein [bacterium]